MHHRGECEVKVPQTFTITIEQAGYLAQLTAGQRSSWIRSAIDNYRRGPADLQRQLDIQEGIVELMSEFLEGHDLYHEYLTWVREHGRDRAYRWWESKKTSE